MNQKSLLFITAMVWLIFSGCDIINPPEDVPAYIHIDSMEVVTDYAAQGSNSELITDAWVYVNDEPAGVYELPATIPLFGEGEVEITVFPGIKLNGISSTRSPFPYYSAYKTNLFAEPATVDTLIPSIEYVSGLNFPLLEDFEAGNEFTEMTITSDPELVFEGKKSGMVVLDPGIPSFDAASNQYDLPKGGTKIFLELDYRNTEEFNVSMRIHDFSTGNVQTIYLLTVTPKEVWHKIYVDLTQVVSSYNADRYQVVFSSSLPDGVTSAEYLWDNVKIVHN